FLEVTYANGDGEVLYFKDFSSGAMIESVVRRAKKLALKRLIGGGEKGVSANDLLTAVREEFKENEDLPNTTNPGDWAKIAGKKGERIVYVRPLMGETSDKRCRVEQVVPTGEYLERDKAPRKRSVSFRDAPGPGGGVRQRGECSPC